jgi:hypothetical protein
LTIKLSQTVIPYFPLAFRALPGASE